MSSGETESPNPTNETINEVLNTHLAFVVKNSPNASFLRRIAESGRITPFNIGDEAWTLRVSSDPNKPRYFVTMSTLDRTGAPIDWGIITDATLRKAVGVFMKASGIDVPTLFGEENAVDIEELRRDIMEQESIKIVRSHRQTHSTRRTSQLRGLREDFIRSRIRAKHA